MSTKLIALATAAGLVIAGSAFAQTSQPPGQQPNNKGSQIEDKNKQTSSGAGATTSGTMQPGAVSKDQKTTGSGAQNVKPKEGAKEGNK